MKDLNGVRFGHRSVRKVGSLHRLRDKVCEGVGRFGTLL
jgi:hypothetical protein